MNPALGLGALSNRDSACRVSTDAPELQLLVEWQPRWQSFREAIGPALSRSARRLPTEIGEPLRRLALSESALVHVAVLAVLLTLALPRFRSHSNVAKLMSKYDIVYYPAAALPAMNDAGGAARGTSGARGGHAGIRAQQAIRLVRGPDNVLRVVVPPQLSSPQDVAAVLNMVALARVVPAAPKADGTQLTNEHRWKLDLAAPSAVAPAPEVAVHSARSLELPRDVVAPAPQATVTYARRIDVLPREVLAPAQKAAIARDLAKFDSAPIVVEVVAPPVDPRALAAKPKLEVPQADVVAPAVKADAAPGARRPAADALAAISGGEQEVVAPAVKSDVVSGGRVQNGGALAAIAAGSPDVVAPAVNAKGAQGSGTKNGGALGALAGSPDVVAPAANAAGTTGALPGTLFAQLSDGRLIGVVIAANPGTTPGIPKAAEGTLGLSPRGGHENGFGTSGRGTGSAAGAGSGTARTGAGPGAASAGAGRGDSTAAANGVSLAPGPGGAGSGAAATGGISGVMIAGNNVAVPSFAAATAPAANVGGGPRGEKGLGAVVTVIANSRSGGAMNTYGMLQGSRVYTAYLDTASGLVAVQYADHSTASAGFAADLTAPQLMRGELPKGLRPSDVLIQCVIERNGAVRDLKLLPGSSSPAAVTDALLHALATWRFRPVLRGEDAVDVDAIFGFGLTSR
jgi:hypothetical protein